MKVFLCNLAREGNHSPYENTRTLIDYKSIAPPDGRIVKQARKAHKDEGKVYKEQGTRVVLSILELTPVIKWIALQEDINYPIPQGFEGRKMPFRRYLEAIHQAERGLPVELIVRRALRHERPQRLQGVDYSCMEEISS